MADVQRHRRQRRRTPVDAPALGRGDLRGHRAHPRRRGRRAREVRRHQAPSRPHGRREAHARADGGGGLGLGGRAPRPAARRLPHPVHRARHPVHTGRDPGDHGLRARPRHVRLPGRGPALERGGRPGTAPARLHHRRRRRRARPRRHQERGPRRRGPGGPERGRVPGPGLPAEEPDAAGLEDAVRLGPAARAPGRRPVPAHRGPCERDGPAAPRRHRGGHRRRVDARRRLHPGDPGEFRLRHPARRPRGPPAPAVPVLRLGRRDGRGPLGLLCSALLCYAAGASHPCPRPSLPEGDPP